jgi:hypothetical protein
MRCLVPQRRLGLEQTILEREDALAGWQPHPQLHRVERLGQEVVRFCLEAGQHVLAAFPSKRSEARVFLNVTKSGRETLAQIPR